jgi:hypothetical protein
MRTLALLATVFGLGWTASAQHVISARSGVVQYTEGRVLADNKPVDTSLGHFLQLQENQQLDTEEGRAEVLLNPGVVLRLGENGSVKVLSSKLTDTRVEVLKGSAILEANALSNETKDNAVTLVYKGVTIAPLKNGLYRIDTDPGRVRVYEGELLVRTPSGELRLKKGHEAMLDGVLVAGKFDPKADDDLYRWSARRSGYMAEANVYSARSLSNSYYGNGSGFGGQGGWVWNPYFGMFSWIPWNGVYYNAFGYAFWSPYSVYQSYYPYYYNGGGYPGSGGGSGYHRPTAPTAGASSGFRGGSGGAAHSGGGVVYDGGGGNGGYRGGSGNGGGFSGGGSNSGGGGGGMHAGGAGGGGGSVVSSGGGGAGGGGHSGGGGGPRGQ